MSTVQISISRIAAATAWHIFTGLAGAEMSLVSLVFRTFLYPVQEGDL